MHTLVVHILKLIPPTFFLSFFLLEVFYFPDSSDSPNRKQRDYCSNSFSRIPAVREVTTFVELVSSVSVKKTTTSEGKG